MEKFLVISLLIAVVYWIILKPFFIKPYREGRYGAKINPSKPPAEKASPPAEKKETYAKTSTNGTSSYGATPQEKGKLFEEFVVKRFKSESFYKLKEWRGDKYIDGIYPESSTYPDLELEFTIKDINRRFAIECKYRSRAYDEIVEFAEPRQLATYKNFERTNEIPVYILLGFGGKPENPEDLFLIPVSRLNHPCLTLNELKEFLKDKSSPFYYNLLDETLN